jgi:copper resistance protein D
MTADVISALVRGLSFLALFQAAGVAIFIALFGGRLTAAASAVRRIGFVSAIAGIVLVTVHYALEAARMAGELSGALDSSLQAMVFDSPMSTAWLLRTVGLALIATTVRRGGRLARVPGVIGALLTIAAFLFVGHTATDSHRVLLGAALTVHLVVVALWFGALIPLCVVSGRESPSTAANLVEGFSRLALWLVPGILLAGVVMAASLIDRWAVFAEGYGLLLLAKVGTFAVLMVLAALNKWRYGPSLAATPKAGFAFRRTVAIEYALICCVMIVTATMTTFFSPEQ